MIRQFKVNNTLPVELVPAAIYYVLVDGAFETYITDNNALPIKSNDSTLLESHLDLGNKTAHALVSGTNNGFVTVQYNSRHSDLWRKHVRLYTDKGRANSKNTKIWVGEATSDSNGIFTLDWTAAGFTVPPLYVNTTAYLKDARNIYNRAWATMMSCDELGGSGYALRGAQIVVFLGGGGPGTRTAPNTKITAIAIWR